MTIEQMVTAWLNGRSSTTQRAYLYYVKQVDALARKLVAKPLVELTPIELNLVMAELAKEHKPATTAHRVGMVKSFFKYLTESEVRVDNPAKTLKVPRFPSTLALRIISHDQVGLIASAAPDAPTRLLVRVLYLAGLRVGELRGLRVSDLGQKRGENGTIWTLSVVGKGSKAGVVRIPEDLGQELQAFVKGKAGVAFVFSQNGVGLYPLAKNYVWRVFKRLGQAVDIPGFSPHWLRHTHASEALRNGANPVIVQRSLRHSSISTTLQYCHLNPEEAASLFLPKL